MQLISIRPGIALPAALLTLCLIVAIAVSAQAPDSIKVVIKANKVADGFYTQDGQGGTMGVLAGPQGGLVVDTQFAAVSDKIFAAIKEISPSPIRFVINTHVHPDHTGGNENFAKLGATIFARDEL